MISSRFFSTGRNLRSALSQEIESSTANPPPQAVSEKAPAQTRAAPAEDSRKPLISGSGLRAASGSSSTGPLRVGAAGSDLRVHRQSQCSRDSKKILQSPYSVGSCTCLLGPWKDE